jgi:hypothetical protein
MEDIISSNKIYLKIKGTDRFETVPIGCKYTSSKALN